MRWSALAARDNRQPQTISQVIRFQDVNKKQQEETNTWKMQMGIHYSETKQTHFEVCVNTLIIYSLSHGNHTKFSYSYRLTISYCPYNNLHTQNILRLHIPQKFLWKWWWLEVHIIMDCNFIPKLWQIQW